MWLGWLTGYIPDSPALAGVSQAVSDGIIGASYVLIGIGVIWLLRRRPDFFEGRNLHVWLCGIFILAGGLTHAADAFAVGLPAGLRHVVKAATAGISILTVLAFWPLLSNLVRLPSLRQVEDTNRQLRREVAAHEATLRELETVHHDLEQRVADRTREVTRVKARFETALRGGKVYAFSQDRDLRYLWAYSPSRRRQWRHRRAHRPGGPAGLGARRRHRPQAARHRDRRRRGLRGLLSDPARQRSAVASCGAGGGRRRPHRRRHLRRHRHFAPALARERTEAACRRTSGGADALRDRASGLARDGVHAGSRPAPTPQ